MYANVSVFWSQKPGNEPYETEDIWKLAPSHPKIRLAQTGLRAVVCDGAGESYFAKEWATKIASSYIKAPVRSLQQADDFSRITQSTVKDWAAEVDEYIEERISKDNALMWYERMAIAHPSATTVLALHLSIGRVQSKLGWRPAVWRGRQHAEFVAAAVGDTCVFHTRGDVLINAFPLQACEDFGDSPPLILTDDSESISSRIKFATARLYRGDVLYACTDALAQWALCQNSDNTSGPWQDLHQLDSKSWHSWLLEKRQNSEIVSDDVTLIRIGLS